MIYFIILLLVVFFMLFICNFIKNRFILQQKSEYREKTGMVKKKDRL